MFSGTKFRLWSRQSSSKKDAEKEATKNKSKNASAVPKGEDEGSRQANARQDKSHLQKLQEDYARLEETVEELTPYKTKAFALEKKLIYITKSFERKANRYSTAIASLEAESEQLQDEMGRMKSICGNCYFCCRHQMITAAQQQHSEHFQSPRRTAQSSTESLVSSKSCRRLQKLEEEQSAIVEETSRQKQETSRCLEQISSEVMKALVSQKVLRRDCTQLQCRIQQLEKQNNQLTEAVFRQYPPLYHSQTDFLAGQRNEKILAYHTQLQLHSPQDAVSLPSPSAMETIKYEEQTMSQKLFRYPPNQRFGVEICRPTSDCVSYSSYIPEQVALNSNSADNILTNYNCQLAPFHRNVSPGDVVTKNAKHCLGDDPFLDIRNEGKHSHSWDLSRGSTLTLRDETTNSENDSQSKNSFNRGSTFSLNDILDGDIDELQLNIQSQEGSINDSASNTNSIKRPGYRMESAEPQTNYRQQDSKHLMLMGNTKDASALPIASDSSKRTFKEQKETIQVPFSRASKDVQSGISLDNSHAAKQTTAAQKRHRYSHPAALPLKSALNTEVHEIYYTGTENSTELKMAEASKALQTVTRTKQAVQKFQLWNFETFFDASDTEKLGTIKERTALVTGSQPQIFETEVGLNGASAENTDPGKVVTNNTKISTSVEKDNLKRIQSDENPGRWNRTQKSISEENIPHQSPTLQNLSQRNISERNLLKETSLNMDIYTSGGSPLVASSPDSNALWTHNVPVTLNEIDPSEYNHLDPSHAMHLIKQQDATNKQDIRPNYCDYHPQQMIESEEREHEQNDIPGESADIKAEMESMVHKKRERFGISNDNISKDLAKDVTITKDKVMALTTYFEEVHVEQCPDCQQSGTRCRIVSAYRHTVGSRDNSLSEDDSHRMDGNRSIDLDRSQIEKSRSDAGETFQTGEKCDSQTKETLASPMSTSKTSKYEATVNNTSICDMSVQGTPHVTSHDFNISTSVLSSDVGLKVGTNARGNSGELSDSQIEDNLLKDEVKEINKTNKTEPEQLKHDLISSVGESKSVTKKIESTEDHKSRGLKIRLLDGKKNLTTTTSVEQVVSKRIQWKSLPSVSVATSDSHLPFQVKYIRTLSLKSFSDALTPPPSPKLHKGNDNTKSLGQECGVTQADDEDMSNISATAQESQRETRSQQNDQLQLNRQKKTSKTLSEKQVHSPTEEKSQGCLQSYDHAKSFTVVSENKSEALNSPQVSHNLHSPIQSRNQGKFEVYSRDESLYCVQNYPQDDLMYDHLYPQHHTPIMNPFAAGEAFKAQLQQVKGCPTLSTIEMQRDNRHDEELNCSAAYPDLLSSSRPKVTMRRSQRSHEMEAKCNVLTEEDIMKYRLDCHDSRRTTMDSSPRDLQSNIVSLADMGSPEDSDSLRILSAKPPLPPRRFHVTKYYVRDSGSNPLLDPKDFFNFENEVLEFIPGTPHTNANPAGNEFLREANQRTMLWDRERKYTSHSRGADFNYPEAEAVTHGGETNSLGLDSAEVRRLQLAENSKTGIGTSTPQGYQPAVGWQSSGKRNSYPDCSGKDYSQPPAWWDDKDIAAAASAWHPVERDETTRRPASFHSESVNYRQGFNSSSNALNAAAPAHTKLPTHYPHLDSESSQKNNSKDTENDFVFNEISKQIENLRQTVSELQKKSTEN